MFEQPKFEYDEVQICLGMDKIQESKSYLIVKKGTKLPTK